MLEGIFNKGFAVAYEGYSSKGVHSLEDSDLVNARRVILGSKKAGLLVEIASRTGNSTITLAQSGVAERIIGTEPHPALISVARYKFSRGNPRRLPLEDAPDDVREFVERQRKAAQPYRQTVELRQEEAHSLSFDPSSVDEVACPQAFHWQAFDSADSPPNFETLGRVTDRIADVLKPGGLFLFSSNGHILRLGEEEINGRRVDDYHWTNLPIRTEFNATFAQVARERGLPYIPGESDQDPSHLPGMFDMGNLTKTLEASGLKLLNQPDGKPYRTAFWRYGLEEMINSFRAGPLMTHFNQPEMAALGADEKTDLIQHAIDRAITQNPANQTKPYYETFFSFVAQKR